MSPIKIVINNRNRLTTTKNMVEKLLSLNEDESIIILDNGSTYPPLLQWYEDIKNKVEIRMLPNHGHLAFWTIRLDEHIGEYFIYTDSDIELNENFPKDWKQKMLDILIKYDRKKVALGLKINDLPEHYVFANQVKLNEGRWWLTEVEKDIFEADTDTTFALFKNFHDNCYPSLRISSEEMIAKHAPWYHDINNLDEEEKYYLENLGTRQLTQYSKQHKNPELYLKN